MKSSTFRILIWGVALGFLGFWAVLLGFWASRFIPGLPVADSMALMGSAMRNAADSVPAGRAEWILSAAHWYREVALPALVAVVLGGVVGPLRRPRPFEAIVAGLSFAVFSSLLGGSLSSPTWIGFVCFPFCLLGAETLAQEFLSMAKRSA